MRISTFSRVVACLTIGICSLIPATAQRVISAGVNVEAAPVPSRVVEHVDDGKLVKLTGNTHPLARAKYDQGLVDPGKVLAKVSLVLNRSPEQEKALADFNARQYDPKSPDFHHWIHAEEFGRTYGPSDADLAAVTSWLENHGFSIDEVSKGRIWIHFTGTVEQVQGAFHVEMHRYLVNGKEHIANDRDPQIPAALAPVVAGLGSLNDFFPPTHKGGAYVKRDVKTGKITVVHPKPIPFERELVDDNPLVEKMVGSRTDIPFKVAQPDLTYTDGNNKVHEDLTPYDFAAVYNITPVWNAGITGTGVGVAIVATSDVTLSDVATYRSTFNLPATTVNVIQTDAATDPGISDPGENTEDLEMVSAAAPGATLYLVVSNSTSTNPGFVLSNEYAVNNETAPIITSSYGACELFIGTAGNTAIAKNWQMGMTEGISIFVATGDSGTAQCDSQGATAPVADTYGLAVSGFSSTPYATAVGGTDFDWSFVNTPPSTYWNTSNGTGLATAKGYIPEIPWNTTCANPYLLNIFTNGGSSPAYSNNEALCNAALGSSNFVGLVKFSGGSGGVSACTTNSTTATTTNYDPTSCSGGYAKPSWQTGTGVPADGKRDVPDVAMFGSYGFGYNGFPAGTEIDSTAILTCTTEASNGIYCNASDYTNPSEIIYQENGGTSAASPFTAGVMALVLQKTGQAQGLANPVFYAMAAKQSTSACNALTVAAGNACYFHDITSGSNTQVCITGDLDCVTNTSGDQVGLLSGYNGAAGYDLTTGLGSLNVANVVNGWTTTSGAPAVTLSPTSVTFPSTPVGTTSAAQIVTVKNTGTATLTITNVQISGGNYQDFSGSGTSTNCGSSLAVNATCSVTLSFDPAAAGTRTSSLVITDNAGSGSQTATLTGTGTAATTLAVTLSPTSLTFASTTVGATSAAQTVTVKNTGTGAVTLTSETLTGTNASSFLISANNCGTSLAASASCTVSVEFKPAAAGSFTASLSVADNATGSPQTVALSGTGAAATSSTVAFSPTSLSFPATAVGSTSAVQTVTLTNTGSSAVAVTSYAFTGANASSYVLTAHTCGTSLAVGASCTLSVAFKPTTTGTLTASLAATDNATGSPQTVALSGTGGSSALSGTLSPTSLTFAATAVGSTSAAQTVTFTNTGSAAISVTSYTFTGTNASSFVLTAHTCGTSLAVGASCTLSVAFKPAATGAMTATLNANDNITGSPQTVALSGTGGTSAISGTLSPSTLTFPATAVGATSAVQTVTFTNTGSSAISVTSYTFTGTNASSFVLTAHTCGTSLAVGASCTLSVAFKPAANGALTATLNANDNIPGSPQTVALSGTGGSAALAGTLSPSTLTFASTAVGSTSAVQTVTFTNTGTSAISVSSYTFTGTNASSFVLTAHTCGTSLAVGASCTLSVAFKPAATGTLTATLNANDNIPGSPQTVALSGTGGGTGGSGTVTLSPTSIAFPATITGTTSDAQIVTLTNTGSVSVTISSIAVGGTNATSFEELSNCGSTLAASASCSLYVAFKPAVPGALTATISVSDTATGSPQTVALSGTGTSAPSVKLSATSIAFPTTKSGTTSAAQSVTLTNTGAATLTLTSISLTGANPADFTALDTCGATLASGASCTVYVAFQPASAAAFTATLVISDNGSTSPQTVALSGTGN